MVRQEGGDGKLIAALAKHARKADADWSYAGKTGRTAAHGIIQYPAMMVPAMQRDILASLFAAKPDAKVVWDPFVGSGTALTETIAAGRSFVGCDINPLAILISKVKSRAIHAELYEEAAERVTAWIASDQDRRYAVRFENQEKWFRRSNSIGLSKIRRAIERLESIHARRFMWVALAETIRRSSNSRTSTYKLHVRDDEGRASQDGVALPVFEAVLKSNVEKMAQEKKRLVALNVISQGKLSPSVNLWLGDVSRKRESSSSPKADIVLTSPPYGDNQTTVP